MRTRQNKTVSLVVALASLAAPAALAQGTVFFANRNLSAGLVCHVYAPNTNHLTLLQMGNGTNDLPAGTTDWTGWTLIGANGIGGHYGYHTTFAQLLGAPGYNQPETALVSARYPEAYLTWFRTGTALGAVEPREAPLPGVPIDAPEATIEMVAWDNQSGCYPDWTMASEDWLGGLIAAGSSGPWNQDKIGGGTNPPPPLINSVDPSQHVVSFNLYYAGLSISTPPDGLTVIIGDTATFSAGFQGTPPVYYEWQHNGSPLVNGGRISGATGSIDSDVGTLTLRLANVQASDAGVYQILVTNSVHIGGSGSSYQAQAAATLTVLMLTDAGLRAYDGTGVIRLACEPPGQLTSPIRINKNGKTYGIILTPTNAPDASKFRVQTSSGVKALMKLPELNKKALKP